MEKFRSQITSARNRAALSIDALAYLAGVSADTIRRVESGDGSCTLTTIGKIADALGLRVVCTLSRRPK